MRVCETAIQVHGGIGNTWDCLAHVFLRRALLSGEVLGGVGASLDRVLAAHGVGGDRWTSVTRPRSAPSACGCAAWLARNNPGLPPSSTADEYWAGQAAWHQTLYDAGFFGLSWPEDVGGHGLPERLRRHPRRGAHRGRARRRARASATWSRACSQHGNADVQQRFLPGLVSGRERWCQGFSEPDAGSDLASLRTRAVRDGSRVRDHRAQGVDELLGRGRLVPRAGPHRSRRAQAPRASRPSPSRCASPPSSSGRSRMINGITREFGEVLFDGARVDAANMIGEPGEGWRLAMTVVSHEREPGELGYVARYGKLVNELVHRRGGSTRPRSAPEQRRDLAWALVETEMLRCHVSRRLSDRLDGLTHGPEGSVDKLLMTAGRAGGRPRRRSSVGGVAPAGGDDTWLRVYLYSRAQSVMGGTSQIQRNLDRQPNPGAARLMSTYDLPDELQVTADGPIRIITLNRPDHLNATNHVLHAGLAALFPQLDADDEARVAVLTGAGRAFSAGGDFGYLDELAEDAGRCDTSRSTHGRQIVTGMVRCRAADRRRRERSGGRARLQPGRALRHRVHGGERAPGRPARAARPGGRRRRARGVAAAHQPAAGQGVRADRGPHPGRAGRRDRPGQPRLPRRRGDRAGAWRARTGSPACPRVRSRTPSGWSTSSSSGPSWPRSTSR